MDDGKLLALSHYNGIYIAEEKIKRVGRRGRRKEQGAGRKHCVSDGSLPLVHGEKLEDACCSAHGSADHFSSIQAQSPLHHHLPCPTLGRVRTA